MADRIPVKFTDFGQSWQLFRVPDRTAELGHWPYISQTSYRYAVAALNGTAFFLGLCRLLISFRQRKYFDSHDGLFVFALLAGVGSAAFSIHASGFFYTESELQFGSLVLAEYHKNELSAGVKLYLTIIHSVSGVQWLSIYAVKFVYLLFFHNLTRRLPKIRIWYWLVLAITISACMVTMLSPLYICPKIGDDILTRCPVALMNRKAAIVNDYTGALDIATDLMIVSVPIMLLSKVKMNRVRKILIAAILSLSMVMVVIAIVRICPPADDPMVLDAPWYFFWIAIESAVAVIMASITMSRNMFQASYSDNASSRQRRSQSVITTIKRKLSRASPSISSKDERSQSRAELTKENDRYLQPSSSSEDYFKWYTMVEKSFESTIEERGTPHRLGTVTQCVSVPPATLSRASTKHPHILTTQSERLRQMW